MGANRYRARSVDAALILLAVAAVSEGALVENADPRWATLLFVPFWTLALLAKPRGRPLGFSLAFAALAAESAVAPHTVPGAVTPFIALFAAFATAGSAARMRTALTGLFIGLAAVAVILLDEPTFQQSDLFVPTLLGLVAWGAGRTIRNHEQRAAFSEGRVASLEEDREAAQRAAVTEERARIARELHDLIAHSLSVVIVQAVAALDLAEDEQTPAHIIRPLRTIEATSREALAEMRRMLGILDDDSVSGADGGSRLADLESLAKRMRDAGVDIALSVEGDTQSIGAGVGLSAYRIVQEALTNVLKHGGENTAAHVRVIYTAEALELEIDDDGGTGGRAHRRAAGNGGHGLVNMRERTALFGGSFEAAAKSGGGYRVRARLPLKAGE